MLTNGIVCEDPENVLGDAERARNAAEAAAASLFGSLSGDALGPLASVKDFLSERLALEADAGDIRAVGDPRFDEMCRTLAALADDLHAAGRLGKPGRRPEAPAAEKPTKGRLAAAATALAAPSDDESEEEAEPPAAEEAAPHALEAGDAPAAPPSSPPTDVALAADGYVEFADDAGAPYWFCEATGESTYDDPRSPAALADAPAWDPAAAAADDDPWSQVEDDAGQPYWYNGVTGDAQYEDPHAYDAYAAAAAYDATAPYDEHAYADPRAYDEYAAAEYAAADPGDWAQYQDEAGNWYWYSAATGESTYDQPAA